MADQDLDDILNSALDDLDAPDPVPAPQTTSSSTPPPSQEPHPAVQSGILPQDPSSLPQPSADELREMEEVMKRVSETDFGKQLQQMMANDSNNSQVPDDFDPSDLNKMMEQLMAGFGGGMPPTAATTTASTSQSSSAPSQPSAAAAAATSSSSASVDQAVRMLSEGAQSLQQQQSGAAGLDAGMDEFFKSLMGSDGQDFDANDPAAMEKMMQNMLGSVMSKEILYEPLKEIADKYPGWLESNRDSVPADELHKYEQQLECFLKILKLFDDGQDQSPELMELFQEMQKYGQPPPEIASELLPGMDDSAGPNPFAGLDPNAPDFDAKAMEQLQKQFGDDPNCTIM